MNKKRKRMVSAICIFLAVLMALSLVLSAIPARAVSQGDLEVLQAKREALAQALAEQEQYIAELEENQTLIINRKAALDRLIEINRMEIDLLAEEIALCSDMIEEKERELEEAQRAEQEQNEILRRRVRRNEEAGEWGMLSFLFHANSLTDLLSRISDSADVLRYDKELEESYREARTEVEELKAEYERMELEKNELYSELDHREAQLSAQIEAACTLIANLDTLSADAAAEYAAIEAAEQEAFLRQQEAAAELQRQYAFYYAPSASGTGSGTASSGGYSTYANTTPGSQVSTGSLIWPTNSTYITSRYGYRDQPVAGASTNHKAIDIGANAGDPIYAAADGYVSVATYNNGLGNYVSIEHDGSTSTRYSHMTNYVVSSGQYVTQGQIIGYVGATGIASGNHLDYAVIQNGQQVDPMQYYDGNAVTYDPTA